MSTAANKATRPSYAIIFMVSGAHLINDLLQFLLPALYPLLKANYDLDYFQLGLLTLAQQITASLLQPAMGLYGDVKPKPYLLAVSLVIVAAGIVLLATASSFLLLLVAAAVMGVGSALFHPEASRIARLASGGRLGFAQSSFQVGGNTGTALGPLAAALIVLPLGQISTVWFGLLAVVGAIVLTHVARWYANHQISIKKSGATMPARSPVAQRQLVIAFAVIGALLLSKYVYIETFKTYYAFFLIEKFALPVREAQGYLFAFLAAIAVGTFFGGPIGDRVGRIKVIWGSILGALPFALLLPHMNLFSTAVMSIIVGLILSSAFSAIVVYAQELLPRKVGMVAGFVFGFAFGIGALGAALLGAVADQIGIEYVFNACSLLLLLGFLTILLPNIETAAPTRKLGKITEARQPG
ncbi:MFS transporter [Devosia neptuniae]|jgi:FSR family fosmidomycin resistance protein-like MFS transporter|uniref:MFS transporter n=1 Tax=Devosia TaxID=46913 RepID=UPI0022B049DA|nr:MFS transporter [Devosia neptuniae]MCZ4345217.1 MFS transporter [Devosia neptuniae]|tara:strand:+ start:10556 stop:11791 length:1236 start_codon:yes stop_codon:yes gene_type:complete